MPYNLHFRLYIPCSLFAWLRNVSYNDAFGDPCNPNEDGDAFPDTSDACPFDPVHDGVGNPCNHDEDGDGCLDWVDTQPFNPLFC
jgi:hypothetical protein